MASVSFKVDIVLTARLLQAVLEQVTPAITDLETLWTTSEQARVPQVMPFGKHKGMAFAEIPSDYKAWLRRQADVDPYLLRALG